VATAKIHIHRKPLDTAQDARHAAAYNEVDVGINQGGENFFVVAHVKGMRARSWTESSGAMA
jgi:hypothetical protein